jgi:hypothetical protein
MSDHNDKKRGGRKQLSRYREHHSSCEICGEKDKLEIHHINPAANGRNNRTENLIRLCKLHHLIGNYISSSKKNILEKKLFTEVLKNFEKTEYFHKLYKSKLWRKYVTLINEQQGFDKNFCMLYDIPQQHEIYKFLNGKWKNSNASI